MKHAVIVCGVVLLALACDTPSRSFRALTAPTAVPSPPVAPQPIPPPIPTVTVGEMVRFQFTVDDFSCSRSGRCRSYYISPSSDGLLEVVITSVSGEGDFISTTEMYLVPGADDWAVGPGPRISVTAGVKSGFTYEIRMFSTKVPSVDLELLASLK